MINGMHTVESIIFCNIDVWLPERLLRLILCYASFSSIFREIDGGHKYSL